MCGIDNAVSQTSLGTTVQNHTHIYDRMLKRFVGQGRSSCEDRNKLDLGDCLMSKERKAALWTTLGDEGGAVAKIATNVTWGIA